MKRALALLLAAGSIAAAQDAPVKENTRLRDAVEWAIGQSSRMADMRNRVIQIHGVASLGALVCPENPAEGSALFRQAITSLHGVPGSAFTERRTMPLPAASFTGLWKFVVPAALKCDPMLADTANSQADKDRMDFERKTANSTLSAAYGLIDPNSTLDKQDNNDRAAQMASTALDAVDPNVLDVPLLTRFLSQLRDRAPELSDDLFQRAIDTILSATIPNPGNLQELAKYLFTSPKYIDQSDADQNSENFTSGGATIEVLTATRVSTNPESIEALIEATLHLYTLPAAVSLNPPVAYALGLQLIPRAQDLAPDKVDDLKAFVAALSAQVAGAAQIQARLGSVEAPGPDSGDTAARDYYFTGRIRSELAGGSIGRAREFLSRIGDLGTRSQLAELIKFNEAARAIESHSEMAMLLANLLRGGVKRTLLYAGIMANATRSDLALQVQPLAARDAEHLPAEQRVRLFAAVSASLIKTDTQAAMGALDQLVKAYNDVYTSPRRGKFDPRAARQTHVSDTAVDAFTDSSLVLMGARGIYEAVQTERGRHNFGLQVPGVSAVNLPSFLMTAGKADPSWLEAPILGIRDDTTRAQALVRLADLRIRTAKVK